MIQFSHRFMIFGFMVSAVLSSLTACGTKTVFVPKSSYPPDPWVKGYAGEQDCLGGEALAAIDFELPAYPRRSFNTGRQGWVIMRLDVNANGNTEKVGIERALPEGLFDKVSIEAVEAWRFAPPKDGPLFNCRILLRYRGGTVSLGS